MEAFRKALRIMMDTPRADGLSLYRIVTGRDRPMGSIPYATSREFVAASAFIERQQYVEETVHQVWKPVQLQCQWEVNAGRVSRTPFRPGNKVWVPSPTTALGLAGDREEFDVRWYGPCLVKSQKRCNRSMWVSVREAVSIATLVCGLLCAPATMSRSLETLYHCSMFNPRAVGLTTLTKTTRPLEL